MSPKDGQGARQSHADVPEDPLNHCRAQEDELAGLPEDHFMHHFSRRSRTPAHFLLWAMVLLALSTATMVSAAL